MMKERRKWSKVAVSCFVLALVFPVVSRLMPKPGEESEALVEQYLLTRVGFLILMAVFAFLGLLVISKYLRCPHCDTMGLSLKAEATFCSNCGYDFVTGTIKETEESESAEAIEEPAEAQAVVAPEAVETAGEEK